MNPVGENHRGLSMLVAGEGLIQPLAYGAQGRRSLLRAGAVPFNRGVADLHYDGAKERWRLTAFDPEHTHDGLREDLDRFYTAVAWAEIILGSHGGGEDSEALYHLSSEALDRLSIAASTGIKRLGVGFLWFFLGIEGVRPDPTRCGRCGRLFHDLIQGESRGPVRFWSNGLLVGPECAESRGHRIPNGALKWLKAISERIDNAMRIGLPEEALTAAEQWLLTLVQGLLDRPLKSRPWSWSTWGRLMVRPPGS